MGKSCVCVKCGHRCEPPKGLKPTGGKKHKEEKKNPFEEYGRDKFLELKAEIEEKKRKILKAVGEDDVLMVRFKYTDDNRLKPIIVTADKSTPKKAPEKDKEKSKENNPEENNYMSKKKADSEVVEYPSDDEKNKSPLLVGLDKKMQVVINKYLNVQTVKKLNNVQATHAYLAAVLIMILLLIALLKRQAELCANSAGVVATR